MIAPLHAFWPLLCIPLFPFLAFWIITLCGGIAAVRRSANIIAPFSLLLSFIASGITFFAGLHGNAADFPRLSASWFQLGNREVMMGLQTDHLSTALALMVSFVAFWIFVYAGGYMEVGGEHEDPHQHRFFAYLSLFAASMLGCVLADNYLLLLICWEGMGLCSYLLIGFWFHKPSAAAAAKKAFLTTRVGDVCFLLGIVLLAALASDTNFANVFQQAAQQHNNLFALAGFLIFIGAVGKSAQFPLHVWLPDAMEGPTPVSALIHAATMVAAGVYLVARSYPLIAGTWVLPVVAIIGVITALMAALIAVAQNDIKRVLAYSTISQLGFMMFGLGTGGWFAGMFHLLTHAFFKALLFLGAGSVIHAYHHEQDMLRMGGGRGYLPKTFLPYSVGYLALSGFLFTSGFFSKDEILTVALHSSMPWIGYLGWCAAFLTAFYMTRQMCLIFAGDVRHGDDEHAHVPHETSARMWLPLWVLMVPALLLGFINSPSGHYLEGYLAGTIGIAHHGPEVQTWTGFLIAAAPSLLLALCGMCLGYLLYGAHPLQNGQADPLIRLISPGAHRFLARGMAMDDLYRATLVRSLQLGAVLSGWFDRVIVDGAVNGTAYLAGAAGQLLRRAQTGMAQNYMLVIVTGIVLLVLAQQLLAHVR